MVATLLMSEGRAGSRLVAVASGAVGTGAGAESVGGVASCSQSSVSGGCFQTAAVWALLPAFPRLPSLHLCGLRRSHQADTVLNKV